MTIRLLIAFLLLLTPTAARAQRIVADVSSSFVAVSVGFTGTKMLIFGTLKEAADVAVVIKGPPVQATLREKKREMGIWINGKPVSFGPVPGFYAIATSKLPETIASPETIRRYGLTLASLSWAQKNEKAEVAAAEEALKRLRTSALLFQEKPASVHVMQGSLFRADFDMPASVPIGTYNAIIYLLRDGAVVAKQSVPFMVGQVGIEATIYNLAHDQPFGYAMLSLALSLGLGGFATLVFRRVS